MRLILIDDELANVELLKLLLLQRKDVEIIGAYTNSEEAWQAIRRERPDAIFTDIEMPRLNGLQLAERTKSLPWDISIVFVTAYVQYAHEAFDLDAIHYLHKPIESKRIDDCIERIYRLRPELRTKPTERQEIRSFGNFQVFIGDDEQPLHWPTAKARELFAYLLYTLPLHADKWEICERLWPDSDPKRMEHNLHSSVSRVRQTLRQAGADKVLLRDRQNYYLDLSDFDNDYDQFERLAGEFTSTQNAQTKLRHAKELIHLYDGPLFGAEDYKWADAKREEQQIVYKQALWLVLKSEVATGQDEQAELNLQRLLQIDCCNEAASAELMKLYGRRRDRVSIVQTYKQLSDNLARELQLIPSVKMNRLYESLLNNH